MKSVSRRGRSEPLLGFGNGVAELDERVARDDVAVAGAEMRSLDCGERCDLLLQLEHDALRGLLADPRNGLEEGRVLAHDRASELAGRVAGDDRERHLRPDAADPEELLEELALGRLGETEELE